MKLFLKYSGILLALSTTSTPIEADPQRPEAWVDAWCAGGPSRPSYAFYSYNRSVRCAEQIARFSYSCRSYVRVNRCIVQGWAVGATAPNLCRCDTYSGNIGFWR